MVRITAGTVRVFLLALACCQVPSESVEIDFIENVIDKQIAEGVNSRVLSGWPALPGQHPWQAALRFTSGAGAVSGCGGVLLHPRWVATSAHCTAGRVSVIVRVGLTNLTTPEQMSETTEFYIHPSFDVTRPLDAQPNDISMVKLQRPVKVTDRAKPIRVQSSADAFRDYTGEMALTSGFGRLWTGGPPVETLHWVFLRMVSKEACGAVFGDVITDNSVCAGPYNVTSQSVCTGDSGGPLVHIGEDGIPTLVGITSFVIGGEFGCHSGYPSAFIRTGPFQNWFTKVTGLDFENLEDETTTIAASTEDTTTEIPTTLMTTTEVTTTIPVPTTTLDSESEEFGEESDEQEETKELEEESDEENDETEESSGEDSSEEDPELREFLKNMEVKVNVKIKFNKFKKKVKEHHTHHRLQHFHSKKHLQ